MKIIVNSDIIFDGQLVMSSLSKRLQQLISVCLKQKHTIIIPLTTLLEFERNQNDLARNEVTAIEKAYELFEKFHIPHERIKPSTIVKPANLIDIIRKYGVEVFVEEPTPEDLKEAHKRACLHEIPHPPDTKSDEMRDLVIWNIALRIARDNSGAMLISRDQVHVHPRGDTEAASVHLIRVKSIDEALEYFQVETPAGKLMYKFVYPILDDLINAGAPIANKAALMGISDTRFVQGKNAPSFASCYIKARTEDGKSLKARIDINCQNDLITNATMTEIDVDGGSINKTIKITPNKRIDFVQANLEERLEALKEIFKE
jgi:hypothetical protein